MQNFMPLNEASSDENLQLQQIHSAQQTPVFSYDSLEAAADAITADMDLASGIRKMLSGQQITAADTILQACWEREFILLALYILIYYICMDQERDF